MKGTLAVTGDPAADELLNTDSFALLIGMLLDQQVPMEWAFTGPYTLQQRLGGALDAGKIAAMDPDEFLALCKGPPAIHRFPGSMGKRVQALAQAVVDDYGGDAAAIWTGVDSGAELARRLHSAPRLRRREDEDLHRLARQAVRCATAGLAGSRRAVRRRHAAFRRGHRLAGDPRQGPPVEAGPEGEGEDEGRLTPGVCTAAAPSAPWHAGLG